MLQEKHVSNWLLCILDAGGNFIDTANYYTNGLSEAILGEILQGIRHKIVLATKYSLMADQSNINSGGNPVEEVIRGLEDLVCAGKILYTGIANTPAWVIAKANTLAQERHWTSFNAIQVEYNLLERASERELIPMAEAENLSVLAWSPLAGGLLSGKYSSKANKANDGSRLENNPRLTAHNLAIADVVIEVANELNASASAVALAWIRRNPRIIPIIGARKTEQSKDNLNCVHLSLSE